MPANRSSWKSVPRMHNSKLEIARLNMIRNQAVQLVEQSGSEQRRSGAAGLRIWRNTEGYRTWHSKMLHAFWPSPCDRAWSGARSKPSMQIHVQPGGSIRNRSLIPRVSAFLRCFHDRS